jgi:hypothetical protein
MRLVLISLMMIPLTVGCSDKTECGEGTHLDGNACVPDEESDVDADADTNAGIHDSGDADADSDSDADADSDSDADADSDSDGTGEVDTWTYEGEGDEVAHDCGTTSGAAWKACDAHCEGGNDHLIYGPYATMPAGNYQVTWRLKTDDADRSSLTIIQLDVTTHAGSNYLAQHSLNRSEFSGAGIWQDFTLGFVHDGTSTLEYRVQYVDTHQPCVWVDWINVVRL